MKAQLARQLSTCKTINLSSVLKKWLKIRNKLKLKEEEDDLNNIILNRLKQAATQLSQQFDLTFFQYCLRNLNILNPAQYLPSQSNAEEGALQPWAPKNSLVRPKSLAMLPEMQSPCCSNYFLKHIPFCGRQSMRTMPLLVSKYQQLSQQKMGTMICALATEGKGVIMVVPEHSSLSPIEGFRRNQNKYYEDIYKMIENGLKRIKQNEQNIKVIVEELPLFATHEIGEKQSEEEFVIRIIVYVKCSHRKKIFCFENVKPLNPRKFPQFYSLTEGNGQISVSKIVGHQIYDKIFHKKEQVISQLKLHRCLFFQNQQDQIQVRIQNFVLNGPCPKYKKNVKLIPPQIQVKVEQKKLTFPTSSSMGGKKVPTEKYSKGPFCSKISQQKIKQDMHLQQLKSKLYGMKMNKKMYEDFVF